MFVSFSSKGHGTYLRPKVRIHKSAGIIRMQILFEGGSYMRKYGMYFFRKYFNPLWPAGKTVAKMHFRSVLLTFLSWFLSAEIIVYNPLMYIYKFENESIIASISTHFWEATIILLNVLTTDNFLRAKRKLTFCFNFSQNISYI